MAILPEWKSRPDSVLYNWAGALTAFLTSVSCTPSMNVEDLRLLHVLAHVRDIHFRN